MMRTAIVYSSQYGTAKRYAEALARRTESEIRSYEDPLDLDIYDNIVFHRRIVCRRRAGTEKDLIRHT